MYRYVKPTVLDFIKVLKLIAYGAICCTDSTDEICVNSNNVFYNYE